MSMKKEHANADSDREAPGPNLCKGLGTGQGRVHASYERLSEALRNGL